MIFLNLFKKRRGRFPQTIMIPTITVFVSNPPSTKENEIVKRFVELGFAPLVDANHKNSHSWFLKNVKPVPHKLFSFEKQNVYFYDVNDLHQEMDFTPNLMIHWNEDYEIEEEKWRWIREWLVYKFYTCYDYMDYMTEAIEKAEELMQRPMTDKRELKEEVLPQYSDCYSFKTHHVEEKDTMLYEICKPNTDLPYTSVIREYSQRGHRAFFPTLYICQSWGVSRHDLPFLSYIWKQLELEGEFNMDQMLKEATEKCYPSENSIPEPEPEVYRRNIADVLNTLQTQQDGIMCGHVFNDIPEEIKQRFK
jgi:hypothetical protein